MADFLASVSPTMPWHVTAFHADYKMTDPPDTTADILLRAAQIGKDAGLKFVYAGNLPGRVGELENTCCVQCGALLIERWGYLIRSYQINAAGCCPKCNAAAPGRWAKAFDGQIAHMPFVPRRGRARDTVTSK
jgi:pyruvate formate lyase activating enzyme